jgi:hypothetical protein
MVRTLVLTYFLLIGFFAYTENKLFLCAEYTEDGNYSGDYTTWSIQQSGSFMHIFYTSEEIIQDSLVIRIYKTYDRKDTNYYEYDKYYLVPGASKKWAANKYTFTKPGNYRFYVYDKKSGALLQTHTTAISFQDAVYDSYFYTDTWYYHSTELAVCDSVSDGKLFGQERNFKSKEGFRKLTLFIKQGNEKALKSNVILFKLYQLDDSGFYRKWVKTNSYFTDYKWYWTFLPFEVYQNGTYEVELYNEDDTFINSTRFSVR